MDLGPRPRASLVAGTGARITVRDRKELRLAEGACRATDVAQGRSKAERPHRLTGAPGECRGR
jgi:hypothetical protein